MDLLWSINIARFEHIFCLGAKCNFYQKVAFWAEPNTIFLQLFVIWAFSAPKSANKRTLKAHTYQFCTICPKNFLSSVRLPIKSHASLSKWCASFHWHCWVDYVFRWCRQVSFVEWVASLRCPHFWALYIVHSLPYPSLLLSIPFLPSRPRAPSNSLSSSIRYFLSLFRFSAYSSFHPCLRLVA